MAKEKATVDLIKISKAGKLIEVAPQVLEAHKRLGWVEYVEPKVTFSEEEVKKMVDDAVKTALAGGKGKAKTEDEPKEEPKEEPEKK